MLVTGAVIVWLAIAIPVGIISAIKSRSLLDRTTMVTTLAFISAPVFWLGLVALYLFAQDVGVIPIFPGIGSYAQADDFIGKVGSMLLPWAVLAAATAAIYARYLRSQMIDVMGEDYIRTARAKGLPERRVIMQARAALARSRRSSPCSGSTSRYCWPATRSSPRRCSTSPGSAPRPSTRSSAPTCR